MTLVDDILGIGVLGVAVGVTFGLFSGLLKATKNAGEKGFGIFGK